MFLGNFQHNLQAKGRLAIPANFREALGEKAILTRGVEPCLQILPFNIWSEMTQNLGTNPLASSQQRHMRRLLANDAVALDFDAQGRILIPPGLRDWARLDKRVVVTGSIDWLEIWDHSTYTAHLASLQENSEVIAEQIPKG